MSRVCEATPFRSFIPLPVLSLEEFRRRAHRFLLFTNESGYGWVLPKYIADGADVRVLWTKDQERVFLVEDRK